MAVGAFVGLVGFSRSFEQQWMQIYSSSRTDIAVIRGTFLNTSLDRIGDRQAEGSSCCGTGISRDHQRDGLDRG